MTTLFRLICFSLCTLIASSSLAQETKMEIRVVLVTALGEIEVALDATHAPLTTANFLHYVEHGIYDGGIFHRVVRLDTQKSLPVKIEVIQGGVAPARENELAPPIPLERTRDTGLRHLDGTISVARTGPDTGQGDFFICVGDQPELDFGGKRNADGQGFAAFGHVVRGMEIVRAIHRAPSDGQRLTPPVTILSAKRCK